MDMANVESFPLLFVYVFVRVCVCYFGGFERQTVPEIMVSGPKR